ncbi:hypothetical protein AWV79_28965 [Cupriavidus sp. UYMMa02A]|nr:hypothetical protein AWV79_28965 [Cupriavidus sp. UYMMa02A]
MGTLGQGNKAACSASVQPCTRIVACVAPNLQRYKDKHNTTVELVGEYDKELIGEAHFDVKEIRLP